MAELTITVRMAEKPDEDDKRSVTVTLSKWSPMKMRTTKVVRATVDADKQVDIHGDVLSDAGAQMVETAILECL